MLGFDLSAMMCLGAHSSGGKDLVCIQVVSSNPMANFEINGQKLDEG